MQTNNIKVLHTVASLEKSSGGPSRSTYSLCKNLWTIGISSEIVTQLYPSKDVDIIPLSKDVKTTFVPCIGIPRYRLYYAPFFKRTVTTSCQKTNVRLIHDHGLWMQTNHTVATVARKLNIPLMISPLGMLRTKALQYRSWKKRMAWILYQRKDLLSASVLHATSVQEAEDLRQMGLRLPIAVVPHGIDLPKLRRRQKNLDSEQHTALFLGRIHPIKGLPELVKAWQLVRPKGWRMVIAGPDEDGHRRVVESAVHRAGLQDVFQFTGPVEGEEKNELYCTADLFILPTFTENFGIVVAEALSFGVPVITTKSAPWESLTTHHCGWWIDIGTEPLATAIRKAVTLSNEERYAMGNRGCLFIEQHFGGTQIAERMASVYWWILGLGEKPTIVI